MYIGGMFGGLEVAECEVERSNELAVGGIESVETQMEPTKAEEEPVSAFSFIQSPSSDQLNSYDNSTNPILDDDGGTGVTEDTSGASSSGFGFLHQQENDITAPASQSSFSFIESEKVIDVLESFVFEKLIRLIKFYCRVPLPVRWGRVRQPHHLHRKLSLRKLQVPDK